MGLALARPVGLFAQPALFDSQFLGNYATININDALLRVPGVGQVTNFGTADYAMRIWVKPDQLTKLGLTVSDLNNAVQQQSAVNPAGQVRGEPAPKGQQFTYSVRAPGRLINAEEFGNVIVRQNPDGSLVRLKDVARIELGSLVYQQIGRFNGKPAVIICRVSGAGIQRVGSGQSSQGADGRTQGALSAGARLHGLARHDLARHRRHERDRARPCWKRSCSSSSSSSCFCKVGARR